MPAAPVRPERHLVAVPAAAARYGLHPVTIRRWISRGLLTGYRVGPRLLMVDAEELDQLAQPVPAAGRPAAGR